LTVSDSDLPHLMSGYRRRARRTFLLDRFDFASWRYFWNRKQQVMALLQQPQSSVGPKRTLPFGRESSSGVSHGAFQQPGDHAYRNLPNACQQASAHATLMQHHVSRWVRSSLNRKATSSHGVGPSLSPSKKDDRWIRYDGTC
jgi:hypothetical protein